MHSSLLNLHMERRGRDLLSVEGDFEVVFALGEIEVGGVDAVAVVLGMEVQAVVTGLDRKLVPTKLLVVAVLVASLDGEGAMSEPRVGQVCSLEPIQPPISEKRDVRHHRQLVWAFVDVDRVNQLRDLIFLLCYLFCSLQIWNRLSRPSVEGRHQAGENR